MIDPARSLRPATPDDVPAIVGLIRELAVFEKLEHTMAATPESIAAHLFGARPAAEVVVADVQLADRSEVVGFALYFTNFSTFLGRPGLYLEDLYVKPAWRGLGLGKAAGEHGDQQHTGGAQRRAHGKGHGDSWVLGRRSVGRRG